MKSYFNMISVSWPCRVGESFRELSLQSDGYVRG